MYRSPEPAVEGAAAEMGTVEPESYHPLLGLTEPKLADTAK
jgi:hypothetical protein